MIFIYIGRSSSAGYGGSFKLPEKPKSTAVLRQRAEELAAVDYSEQDRVPFRDETSYQEFLDYRLREFGLERGVTCSN